MASRAQGTSKGRGTACYKSDPEGGTAAGLQPTPAHIDRKTYGANHKTFRFNRVSTKAHSGIKDCDDTTAESRHEPDNASKETKQTTTASRHEPDSASRETKPTTPRQGTSPTPPQARRINHHRVKARARHRLKGDEQSDTESRHEPDITKLLRDAINLHCA
jgi:FtsZ-interacting cell division protein ZipA